MGAMHRHGVRYHTGYVSCGCIEKKNSSPDSVELLGRRIVRIPMG